ncbi:GL23441 [Drosophila persimilis]|uniref:GL23441 n=1 Tax=Drosophila persimilis TaxID=7234 RepID=B4G3P0_DROPE|nr:GL23441 [Drosophila persimilis]
MAFSVESQTSQARPKSETNNTTIHEQTKTFFNSSTSSQSSQNHQSDCIVTETNSNSNERETRKSQRYNIDDPGASTSTGNNIRGEGTTQQQPGTGTGKRARPRTVPGSADRNSNDTLWREKLIAQLLLLSQENNANSAYEGFGYVHVDEQHNHTDRDKYETKPKNHTDQGANAGADARDKQQQQQQEQLQQQQEQRDRVQRASNSHYQNTLFTRVGTNASASETGFAYGAPSSKLEEFGDGSPYRNVSSDWDCNIPTRTQLGTGAKNAAPRAGDSSRYTDYGDVEEIDVPVFIDEYLQDIEATSSCSSESGKEIFTETDILDFDFDINLIAEDHIELEPKKMDRCNLVMDDINNDNLDDYKLQMDDYDFQQLTGEEETLDMAPMCGINFNQPNNFIDLNDILTGSQDPMLSTFSQTSTNTKCFSEEPLLADENSYGGSMYVCSQESLGFGQVDDVKPATDPEVGGSSVSVAIRHTLSNPLVGLKRTASAAVLAPAGETQAQKRSKLMLKINSQSPPAFSQSEEISTPAIIEQVLNFERPEAANTTIITSHAGIIEDLRSAEEETTTDFSAPNTPHSYYSACSSSVAPTCQSGFGGFLTAPASPAYSVASTSQFSATTSTNGNAPKRKRGRPAKEHADGPDPEVMSRMDDEKRKAYIDRIKNNEASRVSRRKTKSRDELEKQLEEELVAENESLLTQSQRVDHKETLFKNYLMVRQRNNSTFVKKEH